MIPLPVSPEAKVLPFRRRQRPVRVRRRSLLLRLAWPVAQALLLVGAPVALGAWIFASPTFALAEVRVASTEHVPASWVQGALAPLRGRNLPRLPLAEVEARLATNPWVAAVTVAKRLPGALAVELEEKRPVALLRRGHDLAYLDERAEVIGPLDPERGPFDLLLVSAVPGAERALPAVLPFVAGLARERPELAAGLSEVEVLGDGDYRLFSATLPCPLLLREGSAGPRLAELDRWLPELARRYPSLAGIDLRFANRLILTPGEAPADGPPQEPRKMRSPRHAQA
ncbi:MAG: FtsQ-type POTRA domain-containing protein [Thermoanaerobaculia bacterium]|nr:FtsQ-type POTRA domain-containing protein [Thermoanaerobaculia bacterium]MCZ7652942.1 FtsQ-type POTRA domain-containing protein [Thermoanaerobaculia bacterium]